jgi:CIC family chloride channel protein
VVWPGLNLDPNICAIVGMSAPDIEIKNGLTGILHARDVVLHPLMNIQQAIAVFDAAETESLAVVETDGEQRPIGILTEAHAMRRYAEESERWRRHAVGDI